MTGERHTGRAKVIYHCEYARHSLLLFQYSVLCVGHPSTHLARPWTRTCKGGKKSFFVGAADIRADGDIFTAMLHLSVARWGPLLASLGVAAAPDSGSLEEEHGRWPAPLV